MAGVSAQCLRRAIISSLRKQGYSVEHGVIRPSSHAHPLLGTSK